MKLSTRLLDVVKYVDVGTTICDIGCDHGLTSIYCLQEKQTTYVILLDINEQPLQFAVNNLKKHQVLPSTYEVRVGDGLKSVAKSEVNTIIISGLGAGLIKDIISYDLEKSKSYKKFILQPTNNPRNLRIWLSQNGFDIISESICMEKNNFYHTLCVEIGNSTLTERELFVGPIKDNWEILNQELQLEKEKLEKLLEVVPLSESESREEWIHTLKKINLVMRYENEGK